MEKEILYTTAIDKIGNLIHIDHAEKGTSYYCPECKRELILRKSGKTGKGSKRPHFAHNELSPNCKPETVLHHSFKKMLIKLLEINKAANIPLIMNWSCNSCFYQNSGNLIEKVTYIKEEYLLESCRPDIALLNNAGNVIAVIEIVVTHKPEDSILQYYKGKKIVLIQIMLSSDEDLNRVEEKIKKPDIIDFCHNPRCKNSESYVIERKVKVHLDRCGLCNNPTERYYINVDSVFGTAKSIDFTENEISIVKSKRQNIEIQTNHTTKERYPVSICLNCKMIRSRYKTTRL